MRELYDTDFHKPGIYGNGRVWASALDVFRRPPSRGGRGRRSAVDSGCVLGAAGFRVFFSALLFFFLRTHTACCKYEAAMPHHLPLYLYLSVPLSGAQENEACRFKYRTLLAEPNALGIAGQSCKCDMYACSVEFSVLLELRPIPRELPVTSRTLWSRGSCRILHNA